MVLIQNNASSPGGVGGENATHKTANTLVGYKMAASSVGYKMAASSVGYKMAASSVGYKMTAIVP